MSQIDNQIEQIEVSINQAKNAIDRMHAFQKLLTNENFKSILEEGYFKEEASRLVLLKSDPQMSSDENQKAVDNAIIGIGQLRQYFQTTMQLGRMAEKALIDDEISHEELLREEVN